MSGDFAPFLKRMAEGYGGYKRVVPNLFAGCYALRIGCQTPHTLDEPGCEAEFNEQTFTACVREARRCGWFVAAAPHWTVTDARCPLHHPKRQPPEVSP